MTVEPKLSIVIPYYNSDEWIGQMLDSLLDQNLSDDSYEIIVIDDGSTQDATILKSYANRNPIIKYYRKENGGPSAARNLGIDLARGKWVYFCDSDDYVQPQVLGSLIRVAEDKDLEMLVCDWCVVQPDTFGRKQNKELHISNVYSGMDYLALFASSPMSIGFGSWRYIIRKSILQENRIRWEDMVYIEDRIFQLDLLLVVKRLVHANVNLYYYVQHPTSILHSQKKEKYELYASWIWHYITRLSDTIQDDSLNLSSNAITTLDGWRDMAVFSLLINSFRYCPVSTSRDYMAKLVELDGAYPVKVIRKGLARIVRKCMGHRRLWIFMCRVFHLIPLKMRLSL